MKHPHLNAHRITEKLWVGASPPRELLRFGIDVLVLCAREDQGARDVRTVRVPLDDSEQAMTDETVQKVLQAARKVHEARRQGKRVLVTCQMGVNRSALVAGVSLVMGGWTAEGAIERIRERRIPSIALDPSPTRTRPLARKNPVFVRFTPKNPETSGE